TYTGGSTIPPDQVRKDKYTTGTAASRRHARAQVNTQNPETANGAQGDPVATAVRDRESGDRGRADDRRQRVEGGNEGPRGGARVRQPAAVDADEGIDRSGACAREA